MNLKLLRFALNDVVFLDVSKAGDGQHCDASHVIFGYTIGW